MGPLDIVVVPVLETIDRVTNFIPGKHQALEHLIPIFDNIKNAVTGPFGAIGNVAMLPLRLVGHVFHHVTNSIPSAPQEALEYFGPTWDKIKELASQTETAALDTIDICQSTQIKGLAMIAFADDIVDTLQSFKSTSSEKDIETLLNSIRELTNGKQVMAAKTLAQDLQEAASMCVGKSVVMIDALQEGADCLPGFVQDYLIENPGVNRSRDIVMLDELEKDIQDIECAVEQMESINIVTGGKMGLAAFTTLSGKSKKSWIMFGKVHSFAADITQVKTMFRNKLDVSNIIRQTKTLLSCLHKSELIKKLASAASRLLASLGYLFEALAVRVSKLWTALATAADCMQTCLVSVHITKDLIARLQTQGVSIIQKSIAIGKKIENAGVSVRDVHSIQRIRRLASGEDSDIRKVIVMAQEMDDLVLACTSQDAELANVVERSLSAFPSMLTEGLDVSEDRSNNDKTREDFLDLQVDVNGDVSELQSMQRIIVASTVTDAVRTGVEGFRCVSSKGETCGKMLQQIYEFACEYERCVVLFLRVWDLDSAAQKFEDMNRLMHLGERTRQHARWIDNIVVAIMELLESLAIKFQSLDSGMSSLAGNTVEALKGKAQGRMEAAQNKVEDTAMTAHELLNN